MFHRPSALRRPLDLLKAACALALLQGATQAQSVWTNGTADNFWNTAGNWSLGVPGAGNNGIFSGTAPGLVDINGTASGSASMDLSFSAGGYTIGNTGADATFTFNGLTHSTGLNTIAAQATSAGISTISGGTLTFSNTSLTAANNFTGATLNVDGSGTLNALFGGTRPGVAGPSGSSSIAGAGVNLNGGTLILGGKNYDGGAGGLTAQIYGQETMRTARVEFQNLGSITALFNTSTPDTLTAPNAGFTNAITNIDFGNTTYGTTAPFAGIGQASADNVMATWKGQFLAPSAGTYTFSGNSDDGLMVFVDGTLVLNRNNFQGAAIDPAAGTISLSQGPHDIYVAYYEGNGGAGVRVYENDPATEAAGDPLDLADLAAAQPFTTLGNNVTLTASSTIAADNTYGIGMGTLTANTPGVTLTTGRANKLDGYVRFNATNFGASGNYTVNTIADVGLGAMTDGANTVTITKTGNGNLILDNMVTASDTDGTTIDVQAGRVIATRTNTGVNPLGLAKIQLNAAGTAVQFNVTETAAGNVAFDNAIEVNQNAKIETTNHGTATREISIGSATRGIAIAPGKVLTLSAGDTANTRMSGVISGLGSSVVFSSALDPANPQGVYLMSAVNTYTGRTTLEAGTHVRIDVGNALNSTSLIDIAAAGRLEFYANNSFTSATPRIFSRSGSLFRFNALSAPSTALASGTFDLGPGRVLDFQTGNAFTGGATVRHSPGTIVQENAGSLVLFPATSTQVGLRGQDFGRLDLIRVTNTLNGAGDGVVNAGWGSTSVGTLIQINGADRNISNVAIQELNGQIVVNDASSRQIQDGVRLDVGTLGGTIAASSGTTLTVLENLLTTAASGKLTIGSHIPLDTRTANGTVVFGHGAVGDFTGTTATADTAISVINGSALEGRVSATGASGLGGSAVTAAGVALDRGTLRAIQPATAVSGAFLHVGKVYATGAATLAVSRNTGAAGTITEMRLNAPIVRSTGATVTLQSVNNVLGTDERIRFANLADAPARVGTVNMVSPSYLSLANNLGSFVDYDPAQDPSTGPGFVHATYTAVTSDAALSSATAASIVDITTSFAPGADRSVGALRTQVGLTGTAGAFKITSDTGGFILTNPAATGITVNPSLAAATGKELVVYSGGVTGGINTIAGKLISDSGFTKFGARTLTITADNSTTLFGPVTINESSVVITNSNQLGAATNTVVLNGGNLRPAANLTLARDITINNGGGTLTNDGNRTVDFSGTITGPGALNFSAVNPVGGAGGVNKLTGANPNTFSGGLILGGSALEFTRNDQLGANPSTTDYDAGHVALIDNAAIFRLTSGAGAVTTTGRQFTLLNNPTINIPGASDQLIIDNDIRGSGGFTKTGPGTLVLSNPEGSAYTGTTTVTGGALLANSDIFTATGTGVVNVNTGATLGGSGQIEGLVTVNTNAILSPGGSLTAGVSGTLRTMGGLTMAADGNFKWSLSSESTSNPGTDFDRLTIEGGTLNITAGANFTFDFGAGIAPTVDAFWSANQTWSDVIQISAVGVSGTMGAFDIDNTSWAALGSFSTVQDSSGVDLVWTAVPEPGSLLLACSGLGLLALRRRRAVR